MKKIKLKSLSQKVCMCETWGDYSAMSDFPIKKYKFLNLTLKLFLLKGLVVPITVYLYY